MPPASVPATPSSVSPLPVMPSTRDASHARPDSVYRSHAPAALAQASTEASVRVSARTAMRRLDITASEAVADGEVQAYFVVALAVRHVGAERPDWRAPAH